MRTWLRAIALFLVLFIPGATKAQYMAGLSPCSANSISVSGTSGNVQLSTCGPVILLWNITSQELFYNFGTASTTAATTSNYSIPGNSFIVINLPNAQAAGYYLAAITATSTTTLRITQGYAQ